MAKHLQNSLAVRERERERSQHRGVESTTTTVDHVSIVLLRTVVLATLTHYLCLFPVLLRWHDRTTHTKQQELTNGLKTDRGLLSLAVALVHNCCLSPPPPPPRQPQPQPHPRERDDRGGSDRGSNRTKKATDGDGEAGGEREQEAEEEERQEHKGRERLGQLVADRAFCCLLMKVCAVLGFFRKSVGGLWLLRSYVLVRKTACLPHEESRVAWVHFK